jgi:Putative peptidoglycan binding domain
LLSHNKRLILHNFGIGHRLGSSKRAQLLTHHPKGYDMLPAVKKTAIASLTALAVAITAVAPAHAFGKNERNFLAGVATALVVDAIVDNERAKRRAAPRYVEPRYFAPQPVYQPRPVYRTSVYDTVAAQAFNSYSRGERLAIQRQLARQGYYHSSIDGSFGPGTYKAVAAYARDIGASDRLGSRQGVYGIYDGLIF